MPCRDYRDEPEYQIDMQSKLDMLSRIACRALYALEEINNAMPKDMKNGLRIADVTNEVFDDKEIREWWPKHKAADEARKEEERLAAEKKMAAIERKKKRAEVLAKLSPEDRKILGMKSRQ